MLCDARLVSQANYDTEHGSGHWATYIGSSPLNGKNLPDMRNIYPAGVSATTQDGSAPISGVGAGSHAVDLSHRHQWYQSKGATQIDATYDADGSSTDLRSGGGSGGVGGDTNPGPNIEKSDFTHVDGPIHTASYYTNKGLSASQSIQPDSMQAVYYMRII